MYGRCCFAFEFQPHHAAASVDTQTFASRCHFWANKVTEDGVSWCEAPPGVEGARRSTPALHPGAPAVHCWTPSRSHWFPLIAASATDWQWFISPLVDGQFIDARLWAGVLARGSTCWGEKKDQPDSVFSPTSLVARKGACKILLRGCVMALFLNAFWIKIIVYSCVSCGLILRNYL